MKNIYRLVLLILLAGTNTVVKSQKNTFFNTYGTKRTDGKIHIENAYGLCEASNGDFLVTGLSYGFTPVNRPYAYIFRTDSAGKLRWARDLGGDEIDVGNSIIETYDGNVVVTGYTKSFSASKKYDVFLSKLDKDGNLLWYKTYGGDSADLGYTVKQTPDSGFVIAASTESFGSGAKDFYLIKTNKNGKLIWSRTYGGSEIDAFLLNGEKLQVTPDSGFIMAGQSFSFGLLSAYVVKTDKMGNVQWSNVYLQGSETGAYNVEVCSDGGYVVSGYSFGVIDATDIAFFKLDSSGDLSWSRTIGGDVLDDAYAFREVDDGYFITGNTQSFRIGNDYGEILLISTDATGKVRWAKQYGQDGFDYAATMIIAKDGMPVTAGRYELPSPEAYLLKVDLSGGGCHSDSIIFKTDSAKTFKVKAATIMDFPVTTVIDVSTTATINDVFTQTNTNDVCMVTAIENRFAQHNDLLIYPNPAKDVVNITIPDGLSDEINIEIFSMDGRLVRKQFIASLNKSTEISTSSLENGIYLLKFTSGNYSSVQKIMIR